MQNVASFSGSHLAGEPGNKAMQIVNQRLFHSISFAWGTKKFSRQDVSDFEGGFKFPGGIPRKMVWGGGGGGSLFYGTERNSSVTLFYKIKQV